MIEIKDGKPFTCCSCHKKAMYLVTFSKVFRSSRKDVIIGNEDAFCEDCIDELRKKIKMAQEKIWTTERQKQEIL